MTTERWATKLSQGWTEERLNQMFMALTWGGRVKRITYDDFTWDPGNLADGAGETVSRTITGAALGDVVMVAPGVDINDLVYSASVVAANTVEIRIQNESLSTRNLASSTWRVVVYHFT